MEKGNVWGIYRGKKWMGMGIDKKMKGKEKGSLNLLKKMG